MQNTAEAFQAELIATANVTMQDGTYFLALSFMNVKNLRTLRFGTA